MSSFLSLIDPFACCQSILSSRHTALFGSRPSQIRITSIQRQPQQRRLLWLSPQTVKKPRKSSRGPKPSRIPIDPGGVYGGVGRIFASENPIFQSKNRFSAVFAAGIRRIQAKTGGGGREAENPLGFQVSPLAKLPTAQIVDLRRGTWPGSVLPRPPAWQNLF